MTFWAIMIIVGAVVLLIGMMTLGPISAVGAFLLMFGALGLVIHLIFFSNDEPTCYPTKSGDYYWCEENR